MNPVDLSRFHEAFFEESFEGLAIMEAALLQLTPGPIERSAIDAIFRAAHSIKGGAGTFGFQAIASFTHVLETLLDRVRAGLRPLEASDIDLALRAVDLVRSMLRAASGDEPVAAEAVERVRRELQEALDRPIQDAAPPVHAPAPFESDGPAESAAAVRHHSVGEAARAGWRIEFRPAPSLFDRGNDPLRLLRELGELGELQTDCRLTALPALPAADPELCYLHWDLRLRGPATEAQIRDVFAWVEDECVLRISALDAAPQTLPGTGPPATLTSSPVVAASGATPPPKAQTARPALQLHEGGKSSAESSSIRVSVEKIDHLINLIGEVVITQAMLQQQARELDPVVHERMVQGLAALDRNTRLLQEAIMATRMLPVDAVFSRFPRVVRDLSGKLGKQVRLKTVGESTELDRGVIERIVDPLTHLVRNAIDHGIEAPDQRVAAGKDPVGTITLRAAQHGGHIVIEIADDGRGLDRERILAKAVERGLPIPSTDADIWALIFAPGFSTASEVTDLSGRGVGMDVVKKNIQALSGQVELASEAGIGTRVTLRLPLTLAILDGMSVRVGSDVLILPLNCVLESMLPQRDQVKTLANQMRLVKVREEYVPLLSLADVLRLPSDAGTSNPDGVLVLLEAEGRRIAVMVDELIGQQQVVIKSLETHYKRVRGISGATILGDGRVALILDVAELVRSQARAAAA